MFLTIFGTRFYIHHGRSVERACFMLGLRAPCLLSDMVLAGEHPDYISAAIMAVNSQGE